MMHHGLILIPVDITNPVLHTKETMGELSLRLGHNNQWVGHMVHENKPIEINGALYYVDIEL